MEDVQVQTDHRGIEIERVGIMGFCYPVATFGRELKKQGVTADITLSLWQIQ